MRGEENVEITTLLEFIKLTVGMLGMPGQSFRKRMNWEQYEMQIFDYLGMGWKLTNGLLEK